MKQDDWIRCCHICMGLQRRPDSFDLQFCPRLRHCLFLELNKFTSLRMSQAKFRVRRIKVVNSAKQAGKLVHISTRIIRTEIGLALDVLKHQTGPPEMAFTFV